MNRNFLRWYSVLLCFVFPAIISHSQTPALYWKKCYGGSLRDARPLILNTADKGFLLAGFGNSGDGDFTGSVNNGNDDIQLLKLDACGNIQWRKQYGGSRFEEVYGLTQTTEGGYLITGNTSSPNIPNYHTGPGPTDGLACKIDANGNLQWIKAFGGGGVEDLRYAVFLPDSSCIVAGTTGSVNGDGGAYSDDLQGWIVKLDKNGTLLWQKTIGTSFSENLSGITSTPDGNFIVCGRMNHDPSNEGSDAWIVKIDPNGNIIWEKTYGGSDWEIVFTIKAVPSGGYIATGHSASPELAGHHGTGYDAWVIRLDENGNLLWQRSVGGTGPEQLSDVTVLPGNTFVFAGGSRSSDGDITNNSRGLFDAFAFSLDDAGQLLWSQTFGGSLTEVFYSVICASDGSLVFSGSSGSNDGDITGNHGVSDFILFKLRSLKTTTIDSSSCAPFFFQNNFITKDTIWSDTLRDGCGYDSAILNYNIRLVPPSQVQTIGNTVISPGQTIVLHTIATGVVDWSGTGLSCYDCLDPVAQPSVTTTYIVKAGIGNCMTADTVTIFVLPKDTLYIPSAFTPNDDGTNDRFMVAGSVADYSIKVFNRWGQLIFQSKSLLQGWDGTLKGKPQPSGGYVFMIRYKTSGGIIRDRKGTLMLIR